MSTKTVVTPLTEDKIRQAIAESGKMTIRDCMNYLERFHAGNYDKALAKKNAREMIKEAKEFNSRR